MTIPTPPFTLSPEFRLMDQIHVALGSATSIDDFYVIAAGLLLAPDVFGFSRAFILRYDDRLQSFNGRIALGARTFEEHQQFHANLEAEERSLNAQISRIEEDSPEPAAVQRLYNLRYHGLWIQLLQGRDEGTGINSEFQEVRLRRDSLQPGHFLEQVAEAPYAATYSSNSMDISGLQNVLRFPLVAGRLVTRRGLHGILIADRIFDERQSPQNSLVHFQWLINHASVTLDNVELVEELTESANRLRELDRLKTNFLSIVSHELRTPLTSIVGFVHLLAAEKAGPMADPQKDLLKRISLHSSHLQNMVNDILEIAEVESGGFINVSLQPVDPLGALLKVIPKVENRKASRRVNIEPVVRNTIPAIRTDATALERILYHLLDNAIKFIPDTGSVKIDFEESGADLKISINDTGIGISQENLKRIFDHFYQVDFRLERAYGGLGIGLTIVKMLLDATGGNLQIESQSGEGTTVTLIYPIADATSGGPVTDY